VYQARAENCYKLAELGEESGHGRRFCGEDDCQDCSFYRAGHGLATTVLVITRDDALTHRLTKQIDDTRVALRFARSGYESSSIVSACRPAVVVMDSDLPDVLEGGLPESMLRDDRIPGAKVVVACRGGDEAAVRELAMPTIEAPFNGRQLEELAERRTTATRNPPRDVAGA
jgi:DNA-binding NtrC family response regulator